MDVLDSRPSTAGSWGPGLDLARTAIYTLRVELSFVVVFTVLWLASHHFSVRTKGKEKGRKAVAAQTKPKAATRRCLEPAWAEPQFSTRPEDALPFPVAATDTERLLDGAWLSSQITTLCRSQLQRALDLYRAALAAGLDLKKVAAGDMRQISIALITSTIRVGQPVEALKHFQELRAHGVEISAALFTSCAKLCTAKQLFADCLAIYHFVARDPSFEILDKSAWSCLLFCAVEAKDFALCSGFFASLRACGEPSNKDFGNMVRYAASSGDWELSTRVLKEMRNGKLEVDNVLYNTVLATCVGAERLDDARRVLEDMESAGGIVDVITYNTLAKGYTKAGKLDECFQLFEKMKRKNIEPSQVTYGILLDGCINENQVDKAAEIFEVMKRDGCQMNTVLYTTLIKGFARAGQVEQAMKVYEQMRTERAVPPDLITFSVLIKANCDAGKTLSALRLLGEMRELGLRPDEVVFNNLLGGCIKESNPQMAKSLYQEMVKEGICPSNATFSILIRLYAQCKMLDEAVEMLRTEPALRGVEPEARLFAQLAQCCLRERQGRRAVEVYKMMLERSAPSAAAHGSLLGLCVRLNMLDTGAEILGLAAATNGRVDSNDAASLLEAAVRKKKAPCINACRHAMAKLGLRAAAVMG